MTRGPCLLAWGHCNKVDRLNYFGSLIIPVFRGKDSASESCPPLTLVCYLPRGRGSDLNGCFRFSFNFIQIECVSFELNNCLTTTNITAFHEENRGSRGGQCKTTLAMVIWNSISLQLHPSRKKNRSEKLEPYYKVDLLGNIA